MSAEEMYRQARMAEQQQMDPHLVRLLRQTAARLWLAEHREED
ncbi:MAG: hypothetical protein ACRDQA_27725 [Nocardioidaceae bacterium]